MARLWCLALALAFLAAAGRVSAQERRVAISVRDSLTRQPLGGVSIATDSGASAVAASDSMGEARVTLSSSVRRLFLSRIGYGPRWLVVPASDASTIEALMTRSTLTLDPVAVEATALPDVPLRLREFEERRASQRAGVFFTRTDIVRRNTNRLSDLFRGISALKVVDSAGVKAIASNRSVIPRINSTGQAELRYCLLRVVVDGQPKEVGYPVDAMEPNDIHGIEIYMGPSTVPSQYATFGRDANCGVILFWTR